MSEKEELHIPFCIPIEGLSRDQILEIQGLLVNKGFSVHREMPLLTLRSYYGADIDKDLIFWNNVEDYLGGYEGRKTGNLVRVYTYEELMAILKPTEVSEAKGDTKVSDSIKSVSEVIVEPLKTTGVTLNLTLDVTVSGITFNVTRDEAFKLYEDLKVIFEDKIV